MAFSIFYTDDFDHRTAIVTHPITNRTITVCIRKKSFFEDLSWFLDQSMGTKNILYPRKWYVCGCPIGDDPTNSHCTFTYLSRYSNTYSSK